jgi:hypothetical protein
VLFTFAPLPAKETTSVFAMALPTKEHGYSSLRINYADLDDDSDTTLGSAESHGKRSKRQRKRFLCSKSAATWFRWGSIFGLQSVVLVLLVLNLKTIRKEKWKKADTETGGDINGLYIPSTHISITFNAFIY